MLIRVLIRTRLAKANIISHNLSTVRIHYVITILYCYVIVSLLFT